MQDVSNFNLELMTEDVMRGKYLTFQVDGGDYGIEIRFVTEIIGTQDVTPVPNTQPYVKGIMNLRGTIVPIIDMRLRFGHEEVAYTDRTCIVVLGMEDMIIGIIVDEVDEVVTIEDENIRIPPRLGRGEEKNGFVKEIGTTPSGVKQIIDINKVFELEEEQDDAGSPQ